MFPATFSSPLPTFNSPIYQLKQKNKLSVYFKNSRDNGESIK